MNPTSISRPTQMYIALITLSGLGTAVYMLRESHGWHEFEFPLLLIIAAIAATLRIKLPRTSGNMSVNLPFILIALLQLSPSEALILACASTVVQCIPAHNTRFKPVQALFNVSAIALAVGAATIALAVERHAHVFWAWMLPTAAASYFLVNTLLVAGVVSMSEAAHVIGIWSRMVHMSFPYFVASAGITSIVGTATYYVGWPISCLVLLVMYGIYRSYRLYFRRMTVAVEG